jgi:hypothetical protein
MSEPSDHKLITLNINVTKPKKLTSDFADASNELCENHREQILILNQLFLNMSHPQHPLYKSLLLKKYAGYKQQDIANTIYDTNWFITFDELLELLVSSKLICYYCRKACFIHYNDPLCHDQWTLERLSNDHGHNRNNVVIACLKCNLHRGTKSSEKFKLGKQLRFIKV